MIKIEKKKERKNSNNKIEKKLQFRALDKRMKEKERNKII